MSDSYADPYARQERSGHFVIQSWLRSLLVTGLDLIFPPRCSSCGLVDTPWCQHCWRELEAVPLSLYTREIGATIVVVSTGEHTGILQRADLALKYEGVTRLSDPLGRRLAATLEHLNWPVDLVIPVPIHRNRLQQRGYNQAQLLAERVSAALEIPCLPAALRRTRDTPSQVGLNTEERQANVSNAFQAEAGKVAGKAVVVIDDVCTSGATLAACAQALQQAGARAVSGLTVTVA
jgi:competence protein ComFC